MAEPAIERLVAHALKQKLHQRPLWRSLLHVTGEHANISDAAFLLSSTHFSLQNELVMNIRLLLAENASRRDICRFPARYLWLSASLSQPAVRLHECQSYQEFTRKAPADRIYLSYSSENLAQPSSMMGHILLKIAGMNNKGVAVEHSISYYTEINGVNVPKIIFDNLMAGKKGYFALTPYVDKLRLYLDKEQRNVWEYELALTEFQRRLLHAHIWELKSAPLKYFFHTYNCATLTNFILSIASPELLKNTEWTSPLDVVKAANDAGLVKTTTVIPSSRWKIRMLSAMTDDKTLASIKQGIHQSLRNDEDSSGAWLPAAQPDKPEASRFVDLKLAANYLDFLYETNEISPHQWSTGKAHTDRQLTALSTRYDIDVSEYKNPLKTPQDSQWYWGASYFENESYLKIGYLPASHGLEDDNRQFFSENELRLADVSLLVSAEDGTIRLDELQLYSVASLIPRDYLTGGISGQLRLGVEPHYGRDLQRETAGNISGSVGHSYSLGSDMLLFGLVGGGVGFDGHKAYFYTEPKAGLIVNEVYNMKSILSVSHIWNQLGEDDSYLSVGLKQSKFVNKHFSLHLEVEHRWNSDAAETAVEAAIKVYY